MLTYDKEARIYNGEDYFFNNWCWENWTATCKRIKYLGINLPKETKELYADNCKTLMKETKDDINKWRDIHVSTFFQY